MMDNAILPVTTCPAHLCYDHTLLTQSSVVLHILCNLSRNHLINLLRQVQLENPNFIMRERAISSA